jgi:hypothetical protein
MGTVLVEVLNQHDDPKETDSESSSPCKICVVNVHLESAQNKAGADKRARQLNSPLLWASNAAPNCPLVVCGDCNTGADAALFQVLRTYKWHGHGLASVYEHPVAAKTLPVCRGTFMVPNHHYVIDHLVYSHEFLRLRRVLNAFSLEEREQHVGPGFDKGFPNCFCPSDHIPIGAMFDIIKSPVDQVNCSKLKQPAVLDPMRRTELEEEWKDLLSKKPHHSKGKPSPEEIERRRVYAHSLKEWKENVKDNPAEYAFVCDLIKKGK